MNCYKASYSEPDRMDIVHWKYIRKYKGKNGKWIYVYKEKNDKDIIDSNNKDLLTDEKRTEFDNGFDMYIANKAYEQTKEELEEAQAEYNKAVEQLEKAKKNNSSHTKDMESNVKRKKEMYDDAKEKHQEQVDKLKELTKEYEDINAKKK